MPPVKTTMFEVIRGRGMTIEGFCRIGEYKFTAQYLRAMAAGHRAVPRSSEFQNWVAETLHLPRSVLFFEADFADAKLSATAAKEEVA